MSESVWGGDSELWPVMPEPLVPSEEDLRLYWQACPPGLRAPDAAPRVLVLGVTPALVSLPWPSGAELHAVDYDEVMISTLWQPRENAQCHLARWQDMPLPDDYFDLVVGDCSFNALPAIADYGEVLRQVARVSRPGAAMVSRFFVQSEPPPDLARLAAEAQGRFADHRAASMRLLVMLACVEDHGSIHVPDVPRRVHERWGEFDAFLGALGGTPEDIALSKAVFGYDHRLNYPTEHAIAENFEPFFKTMEFVYPDYDVGRHCPIVRFG